MKRINIAILFIFLISFVSACSSSSEKTEQTKIEKTVLVFIQFNKSCDYEQYIPGEIRKEISAKDFVIIGTYTTFQKIQQLKQNKCVIRTFRPTELSEVLESIEGDFEEERNKHFQEIKLNRTLVKQDVTDKEKLKEYLREKHEGEAQTAAVLSEYQLYVTPDAEAVQELAEELNGVQEIYDEALSWVWVSEEYLNGVEEYWYTPEDFLTKTPAMKKNPKYGTPASDCSEQANTLASLLIASGYSEENVRVVLGLVNFNGQRGGHAWVEIYEDGEWLPLEATAGAYYDDETGTLTPASELSYTYFAYHRYPVLEAWYYYNNKYYLDMTEETSSGNAPPNWQEASTTRLKRDLESDDSSDSDTVHPRASRNSRQDT